jgi:4-alpha-glucanotransferase
MTIPTLPRTAGVLLHPTSLPGPFGVGDFGPTAHRWVETLAAMKQTWWQILPLGPTGAGDSPYQSFSAFAGSTTLLSPELLERDGLVSASFWSGKWFPDDHVDYANVNAFKAMLLREAWANFRTGRAPSLREEFEHYRKRESAWLDDHTLYSAIRDSLGGRALPDWPRDLLRHEPGALAAAEKELGDAIGLYAFGQFLFDRQWLALKRFANERGVKILGDAPIFVALDSSDVWAHPDQFLLDADRKPVVVAGVPPDYFSADGQHWGNPIYDWPRMKQTDFAWWVARMKRLLSQVDLIRLDHFRGFAQAWHVPAGEKTARKGKWVDGPGLALFERLRAELGGLPILAEDLGLITPDVILLRDRLELPGMRVLQFALGGPDNLHWPHNFVPNCACYTGTHDNETANGWYGNLSERDKHYLGLTLGHYVGDAAWDLIRLGWSSVATIAIATLQDLLGLGNEARMNKPGVATGNWRWRFRSDQFRPELIGKLAEFTTLYNRVPPAPKSATVAMVK